MTTEPRRRVRISLALFSVVVLLAGGALALAPVKGSEKGVKPVPKADASWADVDRFVKEQKYEEAAKAAESLLSAAKAKGDEKDWTKALVTVTQLRIGLHGYETAVRRLREEPWPKGPMSRAQLGLLYGHSLVTYQRAYSWEIGQRERVDTKGAVDLKAWTREQILAEALKAALEVWGMREALGKEPVTAAELVLDPNDYPKEIRGTLRDAVSYLLVDLLADTAGWTPEQSNEVWRLDLGALLSGDAASEAPGRPRLARRSPADEDRRGPLRPRGVARRCRAEGRTARGAPRARAAAVGLVLGRARESADPEGPRGPPSRLPVGLLVGDGEGRGGRPAPAREPPEPPGGRPPRGRGRSRRVPLVRRRSALPLDREVDRGARGPPPGDVRRRAGKAVDRGLAQEPRCPPLPRPEAGRGKEDRGVEGLVGAPDVRRHEEARVDPAGGGVEGGPSADARLRDAPDVRHPSREGAGFLRRPRVGPEGLRRVRQRRRRDEPLRLRPRPRRQAGGRDGGRRGPRPLGSHGDAGLRRRGRALAFRLEGRAPPGRGEVDGRGRGGLVRLEREERQLLPPPREEGRPRHLRRPAGRVLPAGSRGQPDGLAPLHGPEHLPARAEALLEGPRLRGLAGGRAVQGRGSRHRSPSGSSTRTERGSRRARSRRTPSAPRRASSSSRRGASSAAGGSRARSRAARR